MNNIPAFPNMAFGSTRNEQQGMTLRDYFAAKAIHHWLSLPIDEQQRHKLAVEAYKVADSMLKAREQA